ncbi:MAG: asparaginase [Rhodoferax sp.]
MEEKIGRTIVVLGTGGTLAGAAVQAHDNVGYVAAQIGIAQILAQLPGLRQVLGDHALQAEQVAQCDSKDMDFEVWRVLLARLLHHLEQPNVAGVLITHGTDTLEETAYFLHAVVPASLQARKPVVLTCAMRPASALSPDGPQNLRDALAVATTPGACGVTVVCAGVVHAARDVAKRHTYRLDAFDSGDAGAVGWVEEGRVRLVKNWPLAQAGQAQNAIEKIAIGEPWPRVELVFNHVGGSAGVVHALLQPCPALARLRGLVVAGTGNATLHRELEAALRCAQAQGVAVRLTSRCPDGVVLDVPGRAFAVAHGLSPVKARVALMLELLAA